MGELHCVTGAFGYTGRYLTDRLLRSGHRVRTLTNHAPAADRHDPPMEVYPLAFEDPATLAAALRGVTTLYNTYWVRYERAGTSHEQAVANSGTLIRAAAAAGVRRIVHVSITKPAADCFYPYYRGKAAVEDIVRGSGLSYAIVRPTVIFGADDILVNNIAWLARRFHLLAVPGDGSYRIRPVAVTDLADLCVRLGAGTDQVTMDAVGPESFSFDELVRTVAAAAGTPVRLVHLPAPVVATIVRALNLITGDVVLTRQELDGLMAELVHVDGPATCPTAFTDYLARQGPALGARYHSELARRRHGPQPTGPQLGSASR